MEREHWNKRYEGADLLWSTEANRFLVEEAGPLPPGRALDLGAGEGRNAIWLAARGWRVTAVDFSTTALEKARRLAESGGVVVEWVDADLRAYAPPERAFDLVLLLYMHPPSSERPTLLRKAAAALAPGGTLLVVGHDRTNLDHGTGGPRDADRLYTSADLVDDLRGIEHLRIVRAAPVTRAVTTDEGERQAIDALVRGEMEPSP